MRIQSPIAGNMTGSAGKIIFQHYHGRIYGRSFPVIFHYQPTPAQFAAQTKYYGIRGQWLPLYRQIKSLIPYAQLKLANAYNNLTNGIYEVLGTFSDTHTPNTPRKFGFDPYNRFVLRLGDYTLYYLEPYYYITFWNFNFYTNLSFVPRFAHALYMCPDLQLLQYNVVDFNADHLTFIFLNTQDWFPDHSFEMYVALSDDEYFSNFFY